MGQSPFTLDLRRLAWVPLTEDWFPDLNKLDHGILGCASEERILGLEAAIRTLFTRRREIVEQLGPLRPR